MATSAAFNFIPLRKKRRIETELYVRINRAGILVFPKQTIINFIGEVKPFFIELYFDQQKRALAFDFLETVYNPDKKSHIRYLKINKNTKSGYISAQTSIKPFVGLFDNIELPSPRLEICEYRAGYLGKKLYYVILPKKGKQEEII